MMNPREYYVYIMANKALTVVYIGVTNSLSRRSFEHKIKSSPKSFTARYNVNKLVYYESFDDIGEAIDREKQLKRWSRKKKEQLIESMNPSWRDLFDDFE